MDAIQQAHEQLCQKGNLSKALADVQQLLDHLQSTRDAVAENPDITALHMAKLKHPLKQAFDTIEDDLKEVNKGLNQYQKALKDKFKNSALPTAGVGESGVLARETGLVNRAIGMHLLREGKFDVASTFVREVNEAKQQQATASTASEEMDGVVVDGAAASQQWLQDFAGEHTTTGEGDGGDGNEDDESPMDSTGLGRGQLQKRFADMYHTLDALRNQHDLTPAIEWARQHSAELESRGSNLEFELSRLKFVELYTTTTSDKPNPSDQDDPDQNDEQPAFSGPLRALAYARAVFPALPPRHTRETSALLASLAFCPALATSPYTHLFHNQDAWEAASAAYTREFCSLLGLAERSPLYTAVTAGGIALPTLQKVERILTASRGQWSSVNELPVETPLPPGYMFHSIFVCPVSKEQATDDNPPMMLPCGHVLARESLEMHSKGKSRVKCPYCPQECQARDARRVYI
ncbi:hypothetical protein LTR36_010379 [Oleoguttula mirabilis]|uniref:GID complex catalytic subunit 2 n=1 Tax=Oleoguttula mirabilis TaxID=1507867 RepID=A0AAV9J464_9PEZI|nr:hypothetical protein LTR36_010379 [Oleoguttula mirabilis]